MTTAGDPHVNIFSGYIFTTSSYMMLHLEEKYEILCKLAIN